MQIKLYYKTFVIGIIVLFIGASVMPCISGTNVIIEKQENEKKLFFKDSIISKQSFSLEPGDILFEYDVSTSSDDDLCLGVYFDGDYFYVTGGKGANPGMIHFFHSNGSYITSINQPDKLIGSYAGWWNICYDGNHYYGSAVYPSGIARYDEWYITGLPNDPQLHYVSNFTVPSLFNNMGSITYDPLTDHFWVGGGINGSYHILEIDRNGNIITSYPSEEFDTFGMTWDYLSNDGPWLWCYNQWPPEPEQIRVTISQFDPINGQFTGLNYTGGFYNSSIAWAGGLCYTSNWLPDTGVLIGCTQTYPDIVFGMELGEINYPPFANFSWEPNSPYPGQTITFDGSSSFDPDGSIVLYEWDWDNDGIFDENNPTSTTTYSWDEPGSYFVTLRVIDNENKTGTITYTIQVGGNQPPVADFSWTPEDPNIDEIIIFEAFDSYDPDGDIILYEWDWDNDGIFDESHFDPSATHSWSSLGSYPVTLRVTDDSETTDSVTKIINIIYILVPYNFQTIQEAVDYSETGYYILVDDGTYDENIVIDVELLTLRAMDNKGEVIIDGGGIDDAIRVIDSANGVNISGFTIKNSGSSYAGIRVESSFNNIRDNKIIQNDAGIKIFRSSSNQLHDNIIQNNIWGVDIGEHSHTNIIKDNDIISNNEYGIAVNEFSTGNLIQENSITDNVDSGILIVEVSKGNLITYNDFERNHYGIFCIYSSDTNLFHHNSFIDNTAFNAWDNSVDRWDDDVEGNYWDDYTGVDNNGDGIGDTPYFIPGGDNVDRFPLIYPPSSNYIQTHIANRIYEELPSRKTVINCNYPSPSNLDTIYVPGDYPTIQDAVTNSSPGDTIIVSPGVYEEHVVVDRSLIIMGANADADVIVDGSGENFHVFLITADNVDISGFTIRDTSLGKAGVMVMGNFSVIHGNIFEDCGSGVEIYGRFNKIHDNVIQGNTMSDNHWGVYVSNCFDSRMESNDIIMGNVNGIEIGFSSMDILDNVVKNSDEQGIIQVFCDNMLIRGNEISFNGQVENSDLAGIQMMDSQNCIIDDNEIINNYQYGVCLYRSTYNDLTSNVISDNSGCPLLIAYKSSGNNILNNEIVTGYDFGVFVRDSNDNFVFSNDITNNNNLDCITFRNSCQNIIEWNNFYNSPLINSNVGGFRLYSLSFDNFCFHNNFYGGCDATDECGNDFDDACFCGNYWENYPGIDGDGDGIGDEHYDIFGGSRDDFPLMYPWDPPGKPSKPSGETNGKVGEEYSYSCSASDPNNLKICYGWDWNDDSIVDDWTGFYNSDEIVSIYHKWDEEGLYMVSVIAKNEHGQVSDWSEPLEVTMPRSKTSYYSYLLKFIDLFPILQRILNLW